MLADKVKILKQLPDKKLIKKAQKAIVQKDSVILAESKQSAADFLVTLDKKHFLAKQAVDFLLPQKILTPKMLIEIIEKK